MTVDAKLVALATTSFLILVRCMKTSQRSEQNLALKAATPLNQLIKIKQI